MLYRFSITIISSLDTFKVKNVVLESLSVEQEILAENINLIPIQNTYFVDLDIHSKYLGMTAKYSLKITDTVPNTVDYPDISNSYTIQGEVFLKGTVYKDYLYCKKMFCNLTGRYDLFVDPLNDNYTDAKGIVGMLFNSAQRWLENRVDLNKMMGFYYYNLPANQGYIEFSNFKYVKRVLQINEDCIPPIPLTFLTQATGFVPEQLGEVLSQDIKDKLGFPDYFYNPSHFPVKSIYVEPVNKNRIILIESYYYSKELQKDNDVSLWTMQYPDILVKAVCKEMEVYNNNLDMARMYETVVMGELIEIEKNSVAEQMNAFSPSQMTMRS